MVFRYKKLRAALSLERTKYITQKQNTKETKFLIPHKSENNLAKTTCQHSRIRETIYKEILTETKIHVSCIREIKTKKLLPTRSIYFKNYLHGRRCAFRGGRGVVRGGLGQEFSGYLPGKAGFGAHDILAKGL